MRDYKNKYKEICELYNNKIGVNNISKITGVPKTTVGRILNFLGIERRSVKEANSLYLDENVFENPDEEGKYWIGFLMADGCIVKKANSYRIQLRISEIDLEHLVKYKNFLNSKHKINKVAGRKMKNGYITKPSVGLSFTSNKIAKDLKRFGITERKSQTAKVNFLENDISFWRGMVDGDGSIGIYNNKPNLQFYSASYELALQFNNFIKSKIPTYGGNITNNKSGGYNVKLNSNQAIKLVKILYEDCSIALDRKLKTANKIIEMGG